MAPISALAPVATSERRTSFATVNFSFRSDRRGPTGSECRMNACDDAAHSLTAGSRSGGRVGEIIEKDLHRRVAAVIMHGEQAKAVELAPLRLVAFLHLKGE